MEFKVLSSFVGHIHVLVSSPVNQCFHFTGVYCNPVAELRLFSWDLLCRIRDSVCGGWIVVGDFNEVESWSEMSGLHNRPHSPIDRFQHVLTDCGLTSLPFMGSPFTWSNRREDDGFVEACLDRGVANLKLSTLFPHILCHHVESSNSDHKPLLFEMFTDVQLDASS